MKNHIQTSLVNSNRKERVQPQAIEIEEAVLGVMMIDQKSLDDIIDFLIPEIFYKSEHKDIFKVVKKLFHEAQPIDLYTISDQLKKEGKIEKIGGNSYLEFLTKKVISSSHIEIYVRILQQKFILRNLIDISSSIIEKSYKDSIDVFELLSLAEANIFDITQNNIKKTYESSKSLIYQAIERIKNIDLLKGLSGVPSGFKKIDAITAGWQKSDFIVIAGRPGMGKTAFMLTMARNIVVENNIPVVIFSLEMSSIQLINRLISSETGISSQKLRKGQLSKSEWDHLYKKVKSLEEAPFFIDDTPSLSIFDLRTKCRRLVSKKGVGLIFIDYLQLMTVGNGKKTYNREQEISIISRSLKSIAKELDVPVIALSQLSRAVENRGGPKRPLLSDLRESGAIEQDADIVSFIYRPEYYGFSNWDTGERNFCKGEAEIIFAKNRNGIIDNIRLRFINERAQFIDLEEYTINSSPKENIFSLGEDDLSF